MCPCASGLKIISPAVPSTGSIFSTSCGRYNVPPFPIAAMNRATCKGVTCTVPWPMAWLTTSIGSVGSSMLPDFLRDLLDAGLLTQAKGARHIGNIGCDGCFDTKCSQSPRRTDCRSASSPPAGLAVRMGCCRKYCIPCPMPAGPGSAARSSRDGSDRIISSNHTGSRGLSQA